MRVERTAEIVTPGLAMADTPMSRDGWSQDLPFSDLTWSILATLVYGDIFEFPMREEEIHHYLIGREASLEEIHHALDVDVRLKGYIERSGSLTFLAGRQRIEAERRARAETAERLWPAAASYAARIAALPFVRMIAVTGALALDNTDESGDIDYLVVTAPGRVWLTRAFIVLLVRAAALRGTRLCPNYLLSETALHLLDRDLYAAHELAQMIPVFGLRHYWRMRRLNQSWLKTYLPNAGGLPLHRAAAENPTVARGRGPKRLTERLLSLSAVDPLERWEASRKIQRFRREAAAARGSAESSSPSEERFSPEWCKGHFDHHATFTMGTFSKRLEALARGWR